MAVPRCLPTATRPRTWRAISKACSTTSPSRGRISWCTASAAWSRSTWRGSRQSASPAWCSPTPTFPPLVGRPGRAGTTAPACSMLDDAGVKLDTRDPYFGYRLLTEVARMQLDRKPVPPELEKLVGPLVANSSSKTAAQWLRLMQSTSAERSSWARTACRSNRCARCAFRSWPCTATTRRRGSPARSCCRCGRTPSSGGCATPATSFPRAGRPKSSRPAASSGAATSSKLATHRAGEPEQRHFRSDRVFQAEDGWYCLTREAAARPLHLAGGRERAARSLHLDDGSVDAAGLNRLDGPPQR